MFSLTTFFFQKEKGRKVGKAQIDTLAPYLPRGQFSLITCLSKLSKKCVHYLCWSKIFISFACRFLLFAAYKMKDGIPI